MKIIEFTGLTGSGKTTACNKWISELSCEKKIFTYRDLIMLLHLRPVYIILVYLNPFRWRFNKLLKAYANEYEHVSKNALHVLMAMNDALSILNLLCKNGIVVLDEGFVQTLTSIPHLQKIKNETVVQNIIDEILKRHDITVLDCRIDKKACITRLRKRNSGDRFNAIRDDAKLLEALETKQNNIDIVTKCLDNTVLIDMNGSHDFILEQIRQNLY